MRLKLAEYKKKRNKPTGCQVLRERSQAPDGREQTVRKHEIKVTGVYTIGFLFYIMLIQSESEEASFQRDSRI